MSKILKIISILIALAVLFILGFCWLSWTKEQIRLKEESKQQYEEILTKERAENALIRDSLMTELLSMKNNNDSLHQLLLSKSNDYNNIYASYQRYKRNQQQIQDTLLEMYIPVDICDSVVESCNDYVNVLSSSLENCNGQIVVYDSIFATYKRDSIMNALAMYDAKNHINNQLRTITELERKRNSFWNKNKFWIGLFGGAVISGAIVSIAK